MPEKHTSKVFILGGSVHNTPYHVSAFLGKVQGPILAAFLEHACRVLRAEVATLARPFSSKISSFSSINALCALEDQNKLHPALKYSLTCISELAYVINILEIDNGNFPTAAATVIAGLDVGALAAAAICASQNLTQLLHTSLEVVRISLHTSVTALSVSNTIESSCAPDLSWSLSISNISFEKVSAITTEFGSIKVGSPASKPYVSAVNMNDVSVSGPPSTLEKLRSFPSLQEFKTTFEPVHAAYHARHLYTTTDISRIMNCLTEDNLFPYKRKLQFVSPVNGAISWSQTFRSLVEEALVSILIEPIREDIVIQKIKTWLQNTVDSSVQIFPVTSSDSFVSLDKNIPPSSPENCKSQPISRSKIAIIGFSGRFPEADNLAEFWDLLYKGRDVHKVVPPTRWDAETHVDVTGKRKNTSATPYGCWVENAGLFDAKFFHLSPREAPQVDPAQRLALMTAYEAIEQAGIVPDSTPSTKKDRVGVFYGVTSNDWMETNSSQNIDTYMIPGGNRAFIPGRVNYFFKFSGPSYSIDTACSSSLASMHAACNSLWRGDVDTAIAGGTNILTNPDFTAGLDRGHFLSRTGNCKSFDDSADGYCRGEGVVTLILKRYEDAIADNDPIHGFILSAYTNHSADAESITRPHGGAQKAILNKLLYDTGTKACDVSYVEMHGTGTQAGDAEEMRSVLDVFAPQNAPIRTEDQALYLGSVKANIGHGEAASGVSSLAKVLLMMKNNTIPPHCGVKTKLNTKFPSHMASHNVRIAKGPTAWPRQTNGSRKVVLNNFSAAGGNSALILEDAPLSQSSEAVDADPRTHHVVAISAKSVVSLEGNIDALLKHIENSSPANIDLPALSYTTTARRIHHMFRVMVSGSTIADIKAQLIATKDKVHAVHRVRTAPHLIFAFTGQGSQYSGMGRELYKNISSFRCDLDRYDQLAQNLGFPSFVQVITDSCRPLEDFSPVVIQIATTCLEMALGRLWKSWGVTPRAVVGHSLGEYAALHIAGVLSECDTIYLVGQRAKLLEEYCTPNTHSMLAVKASSIVVQSFLAGSGCEIATINGPEDTVLSGENRKVKQIQDVLTSKKIKSTFLKVPYAFHSSQVEPILQELDLTASKVTVSDPKIPVICGTNASIVKESPIFNSKYFSTHCRQPVNMLGAIQNAKQEGIVDEACVIIEIGPQPIVSKMINSILKTNINILALLQNGVNTWKLLGSALTALYTRGVDIHWREYHRDFHSSQRVLELPSYSWDLKTYWIQYKNDWSLYKGEAPNGGLSSSKAAKLAPLQTLQEPVLQKLESTTIHRILEENMDSQSGKLVIEADISRSDLNPLVKGHKVNGIPLCTPSVYAEHCLSIGTYLLKKYRHGIKETLVEISEMVLEKALIAQSSGSQTLRTSVNVDWVHKMAFVVFESYTTGSIKPSKHATSKIHFKDMSQEHTKRSQLSPTVKQQILSLKNKLDTGKAYRFNRSMIYKMVGALAQFDSKYTGLKEITLDSNSLEACGTAEFSHVENMGEFYTNPAFIDSLSQIGGFIMNCNDNSNLDEEVFMNHGWDRFAIFEKLSKETVYTLHAKMQEAPGNKWKGDVTVFDNANVVAYFDGITLQGVAKRALHYILSREQDLGSKSTRRITPGTGNHSTSHMKDFAVPRTSSPRSGDQDLAAGFSNSHPSMASSKVNGTSIAIPPPRSNPRSETRTSKKADAALQIISEESGLPLSEITDNVKFSELGVDSLLLLIIAGRFEEELGILVDSTIFSSMPTVKSLKNFILKTDADETDVGPTSFSHFDSRYPHRPSPPIYEEVKFSPTPPAPENMPAAPISVSHSPVILGSSFSLEQERSVSGGTSDIAGGNSDGKAFQEALYVISEESGVSVEELTEDTYFGDIGVDSLLSLIIVGRLKEELFIDLDFDNSPFVKFPTIKDFRAFFQRNEDQPQLIVSSTSSVEDPNLSSSGSDIPTPSSEVSSTFQFERKKLWPARSIILQGKPFRDPETLFLLPDGGGSAASYARLPRIKPGLAVVGLNCPFVRHPKEMLECTLDDLIDAYLTEIKKRQPNGPYNLGGWSSGGILAYRLTQRLIQDGEQVTQLILIDSPPPRGLDRLPQRFYDFCGTVNLFDATKNQSAPTGNVMPTELLAHFKSNIELLHGYCADPLPEGFIPSITVIYATECVFDGVTFPFPSPEIEENEGMKFLTEKRTDFSASSWASFFPGEEIKVEVIHGATHFSIMGKYATSLAEVISRAMC